MKLLGEKPQALIRLHGKEAENLARWSGVIKHGPKQALARGARGLIYQDLFGGVGGSSGVCGSSISLQSVLLPIALRGPVMNRSSADRVRPHRVHGAAK